MEDSKVDPIILALIYEDAENSVRILREDVNAFNTRLVLLLGFSTIFTKVAIDLPVQGYGAWFKVVALGCIVLSIVACLWGLFPKGVDVVIFPNALLEDTWNATEQDYRLAVIEVRDKTARDFIEVITAKASRFKLAIGFLGLAVAIAAVAAVLLR